MVQDFVHPQYGDPRKDGSLFGLVSKSRIEAAGEFHEQSSPFGENI